MKKFVSIVLMLALVLSLSVVAFAVDSPARNVTPEEVPDTGYGAVHCSDLIDKSKTVVETDDGSEVDPEAVKFEEPYTASDEEKAEFRTEAAAVINDGAAVYTNFRTDVDESTPNFAHIKTIKFYLRKDLLPAGAKIYINGEAHEISEFPVDGDCIVVSVAPGTIVTISY